MTYIDGAERIREEIHKILSNMSYKRKDNTTYCNMATFDILERFGLQRNFWDKEEKRIMLANEMCEVLDKTYIHIGCDCDKFPELINSNFLMIASWKNDNGHGHIAPIYPSRTRVFSNKWKKNVPLVGNVGYENGVMGLNWAFPEEPKIYIIGEIDRWDIDE